MCHQMMDAMANSDILIDMKVMTGKNLCSHSQSSSQNTCPTAGFRVSEAARRDVFGRFFNSSFLLVSPIYVFLFVR
jgi:hypothetical protein